MTKLRSAPPNCSACFQIRKPHGHTWNPAYWRGYAAAYARWVTAETGPDLIERSNNPAHWRGYAAAHAHWASRNYFQADRKTLANRLQM